MFNDCGSLKSFTVGTTQYKLPVVRSAYQPHPLTRNVYTPHRQYQSTQTKTEKFFLLCWQFLYIILCSIFFKIITVSVSIKC
jgi:hypothetical protein